MKYKFYRTASVLLACVMLFSILSVSLFSCSEDGADTNDGEIAFEDALGREISVKKHPKRVAALLGSFADIWLLSGGELCAAPEDAWEDFGLELDGAVNIGGAHSPSLELLISAEPDFVIASASTAADVEMKDTLLAMGISVAYFDVDSFEDYLAMLNICTDITERKDLYKKNGTDLEAKIEKIKSDYKALDIPDEQRRVLLLRASSTTVKAKGSRGTILGEMLYDMGCINIADKNGALLENLSVEAVIKEEPYHVLVVTMGSNTEKAVQSLENMIKENPAWSTLGAVREGRLSIMDKTLFNLKPNSRWAESYEKLYETLTKN